MHRVIIIEDEAYHLQMLREKLEEYFPDLEIIAECNNADDALFEILRLNPDLLFLDIQMPEKNGFWLVEKLQRMESKTFSLPNIIFTTNYTYSDYLIKAFEVSAVDYLLKPVSIESLEKAVERYRRRNTGPDKSVVETKDIKLLKFKSYDGLFLFHPDDVAYIEADRDYAIVHLTNGAKDDIFERLGEIEKKLPPEIFIRAGKSIIINRKYIRKITNTAVLIVTPFMKSSVKISFDASRSLKDKFY